MNANQPGFGQVHDEFNPVINLDDASGMRQQQGQVPASAAPPPLTFFGSTGGTGMNAPGSDISGLTGEPSGPELGTDQLLVVGDDGSRLVKALGGLLALMILGGVIVHITGESTDPIKNIFDFIDELFGLGGPKFEVVSESAPPAEVEPETPIDRDPKFSPDLIGENPYTGLPNPLLEHPAPMNGVWSAAEEERWRVGLEHQFVYQRWKTVREIRAMRLEGSSDLLNLALDQRKFWTRMEAAVGLAEFGFPVDAAAMRKVLGRERSALVKSYFRRYLKRRTAGELHVMRQAIKLVDPNVRLMILKVLARDRSQKDVNSLYLAGATYETDRAIQRWVATEFNGSPVGPVTMTEYQRLVVADALNVSTVEAESVEPMQVPVTRDPAREENIVDDVEFLPEGSDEEEVSDEEIIEPLEDDGFSGLQAE